MRKSIISLVWLFALVSGLPACAGPLRYSAAPIEAWVVDKETGQPLEGVVVVANWVLESTSRVVPHQTNPAGSLVILETVTDRGGRFYFPAWGPKWHLGSGELTDSDPELILFKSGYKYLRVSNSQYLRPSKYSDVGKPSGTESRPTGSKRISFWSGERIGLEKFKGSQKDYAEQLSPLHTSIRSILSSDRCDWRRIPRLMIAIDKLEKGFRSQGIYSPLYSIEDLPNGNCGSPQEFFKGFQQ